MNNVATETAAVLKAAAEQAWEIDSAATATEIKRALGKLESIRTRPQGGDDTFSAQRIGCADGPNVRFSGRARAEASTQRRDGGRDRWQEMVLWETRGGAWVLQSTGASDVEGERDIVNARVIGRPPHGHDEASVMAAMEWLGWTRPARDIAKQMGWVLERVVP